MVIAATVIRSGCASRGAPSILPDPQGGPSGTTRTSPDRKLAEESLRESENAAACDPRQRQPDDYCYRSRPGASSPPTRPAEKLLDGRRASLRALPTDTFIDTSAIDEQREALFADLGYESHRCARCRLLRAWALSMSANERFHRRDGGTTLLRATLVSLPPRRGAGARFLLVAADITGLLEGRAGAERSHEQEVRCANAPRSAEGGMVERRRATSDASYLAHHDSRPVC